MSFLELSGAASALILAVLVLRRLTLHRLPKGTFLVLWWAAICRLLIPFSIPARFSVYTALDRLRSAGAVSISPAPVVPGTTPVVPGPAGPLPDLPLPDAAVPTAPMPVEGPGWTLDPLVLVYLLGVLACALCFAAAYIRCRREFGTALPVDSPFLREWKQSHPIPVRIKRSERISAPLTYGLLRPVVLMPKGTDWVDEETLGYVLAHEYVHIRRGDLWMKLALAICLCVHWFNPLVWVMYRLANRDMELACDEAVVRTFGLETRPAYAMSLIRWEETRRGFMPLCGNFSKSAMEERVTAVMKLKKRSAATVLTAVVLAAAVVAGFATSCAPKSVNVPLEEPVQGQEDQSAGDQSAASELPQKQPDQEDGPVNLPDEPLEEQPDAVHIPEDETESGPPAQPVEDKKKPEQPKSAYPVNSQGHTYGVWTEADGYEDVPDLIYYRVDEAYAGYMKREDLYPYSYPVETVEEKEEYLAWCSQMGLPHEDAYLHHDVQLYDQNGRVVSNITTTVEPTDMKDLRAEAEQGNILRPILPMSTVPAEDIPAGRRPYKTRDLNDLTRQERQWLKENTVDGDWPRNNKGETYGDYSGIVLVGYEPDLVGMERSRFTGEHGYVRWKDLRYPGYPRDVTCPAEEKAYYAWRSIQSCDITVPVYDREGNKTGSYTYNYKPEFRIKDEFPEQEKKIRADMKGGGWTDEEMDQAIADFKKGRAW